MQKKQLKNKFKLTPEVYKSIKLLAQNLPKFQKRDAAGNLLWRDVSKFDGLKDFMQGGGKIPTTYKKQILKGKEPLLVNHEVNMVEIYQKDGWVGLNRYVDFFKELSQKNHESVEPKP
jgi:hypothetical protein